MISHFSKIKPYAFEPFKWVNLKFSRTILLIHGLGNTGSRKFGQLVILRHDPCFTNMLFSFLKLTTLWVCETMNKNEICLHSSSLFITHHLHNRDHSHEKHCAPIFWPLPNLINETVSLNKWEGKLYKQVNLWRASRWHAAFFCKNKIVFFY